MSSNRIQKLDYALADGFHRLWNLKLNNILDPQALSMLGLERLSSSKDSAPRPSRYKVMFDLIQYQIIALVRPKIQHSIGGPFCYITWADPIQPFKASENLLAFWCTCIIGAPEEMRSHLLHISSALKLGIWELISRVIQCHHKWDKWYHD